MKTKIERYTDKFIEANFDKRDRKENEFIKFEYFVNSLHCWEYSSESFNSRPKIGKEISLGKALGGDAFFLLIGNRIYSLQSNLEDVKEEISKNHNKIEFHLLQVKKSKKVTLSEQQISQENREIEAGLKNVVKETFKGVFSSFSSFIEFVKDKALLILSFSFLLSHGRNPF